MFAWVIDSIICPCWNKRKIHYFDHKSHMRLLVVRMHLSLRTPRDLMLMILVPFLLSDFLLILVSFILVYFLFVEWYSQKKNKTISFDFHHSSYSIVDLIILVLVIYWGTHYTIGGILVNILGTWLSNVFCIEKSIWINLYITLVLAEHFVN